MIKEISANMTFELKVRSRLISSYVYFSMFFFLAFLMALGAGGAFSGVTVSFGTSSKVLINSPLSVASYMGLLTAFTLFIIAAVFGQATCKDYINRVDQIIFTTPMRTSHFLIGRFLGALIFMFFISLSIPLGIYFASVLPFVLPSMVGANSLSTYLVPMFTVALPNIFIFGSFFFLFGTKTKKMTAIYISATLLFLLWNASGQLLKDVDNKTIATLLDPIGLKAASETFRYWTVDQQNNKSLVFESYYLWNRLLWLTLGLLSFLFSLCTFSRMAKKETLNKKTEVAIRKGQPSVCKTRLAELNLADTPWLPVFWKQLKFELKQSLQSIYFLVIVLAGVGYMFITGTQIGKIFGTNTYPVTYNVLEIIGGVFSLFILIIISLYTGEAVWRDRELKMSQIVDALPVHQSVFLFAKFVNIVVITVLLLTTMMLSGLSIQLAYGYTKFELGHYLTHLYLLELPSYLNIIALTFFLHIIFRNKYLAHGLVILFYISSSFASTLGFEHRLYNFGSIPAAKYSDMNGYGHLLKVFHIYNTYWIFLSVMLTVLSYLFWQRGTVERPYKDAALTLRKNGNRSLAAVFSFALLGFVFLGSYIFYQTNIISEYMTSKEKEQRAFDYEKKYKTFETLDQPELFYAFAKVDIFPDALKAKSHVQLKYRNNTEAPISKILLNSPTQDWSIDFSRKMKSIDKDTRLRFTIYNLETPLMPGEEIFADYFVEIDNSKLENGSNIGVIHNNGTFFNNMDYYPNLGYAPGRELSASKTREKYNLNPKLRVPSIHDRSQYKFNYIGRNLSWIDFESIVSTSGDQVAIAPGTLQRKWTQNGRNYFHYKMDQKILNFYAFLSAKYEVIKDKWNDVDIEIYYHKGHEYNLHRMIESTKKALDYYTQNFGPYQHKQYRIIEFPRYQTFAQSFPNTVPFSEGIGFIARVDDKVDTDIDYPFYVNAHELAHQWWPHQMIGANVQGSVMLSESFSQYSALMVMEKNYGREKMKKFLKYELDKYLYGRGQESEYESPLYLAEGQNYIHYNKASVIFYALKDYIGENVMNASMREALRRFGKKGAPYMTTLDFIAILKSKAHKKDLPIVEDMLEKIVLFENRPLIAEARLISGDDYEVTFKVSAKKIRSDKDGKESFEDFEQEMDVGIIDKNKNYIYLKKHLVRNGESTLKIRVQGRPDQAGLDPLNILIDRNSGDNIIPVQIKNAKVESRKTSESEVESR